MKNQNKSEENSIIIPVLKLCFYPENPVEKIDMKALEF